jgi:hypothetical protein
MMHSGAATDGKPSLNQILYEVTSEKIMELQRQKDVLDRHYSGVLEKADASRDLLQEIEVLYQGIKEAPVQQKTNINMESARLFIENVAKDSSTSEQLLRHWIDSFRKEIQYSTCKCTYSYIYGKSLRDELSEAETPALDTEFYVVSKEKKEQMTEREKTIKELEERVFEAGQINSDGFKAFLDKTFDMEEVKIKKVLDRSRKDTEEFCKNMLENDMTVWELKNCVEGLLGCDLLNSEKQATLRQLKESEPYLQDLATLLSSRIKAVKYWNWPEKGVYVDVRRSIAGRYRAFLDEDIITALFLQYIGVRFAVHLKSELIKMYNIGDRPVSLRRGSGPPSQGPGIDTLRHTTHWNNLLSVLPDSQQAQANFAYEYNEGSENTAVNIKNSLIHLLATEAQLHKLIKPDQPFTVVRTDMEWFGPSIEHESIKIVLEFLGVTDVWVDFMMRFLNVPMTFQKDVCEDVRIRRRGVPISHQLSALFGECILFMMEAAVKHQTGISLQRIHDDFWFWDSDQDKVVQAWRVMNEYASLVNLQFNTEKSGSAVVGDKNKSTVSIASFGPSPLPQARVWWGSLVFRADGLFQIDHALIEPHIKEMQQKLKTSKTVLSWVNVYNKYIAFFLRGFGSCAKVLGTQHLDQIGECMQMIQKRVFHEQNGNALAALKKQFEIFQSTDILDMWAYWPLPAGGLGMKNYLMDIGALRETFINVEHTDFTDLPKEDKVLWEEQEKNKETNRKNLHISVEALEDSSSTWYSQRQVHLPQTFEEYCGLRETKHPLWTSRFRELLEVVELSPPIELCANINTQLDSLGLSSTKDVTYAKRVISYYDNQLGKAFGSLEFLDMALIPNSLVQSLNKAKVQWDA